MRIARLLSGAILCGFIASAHARYALQGSLTSAIWLRENARSAVNAKGTSDPNDTSATYFQYFRLSTSRFPPTRSGISAQFYVSGRWMNALDVQSNLDAAATSDDFRLYESYVDLATPRGWQFRAGRQYLPNAVGFWELDGVRWQQRFAFLTATVYGGSGASSWQFDESKSRVVGGHLEVRAKDRLRARGGAMATFPKRLADYDAFYLFFGFDASTLNPISIHPTDKVRGTATADIAVEPQYSRVARASGVARLDSDRVSISAELRYDTPSFAADSIFRVFAVEPTRETSLGVESRPLTWLAVNGRLTRQRFDDGSASRERLEMVAYDGYEPVLRAGVEWLDWAQRSRRYLYFRAQRQVLPFLTVGVGNAMNTYRYVDDASNVFTRTLQGDMRIRFSPNWRLLARIERNRNRDYRSATRFLAWLQTSFAATNGGEP